MIWVPPCRKQHDASSPLFPYPSDSLRFSCPLLAGMEDESNEALSQSIFSASPVRSRRTRCSFSHTLMPASVVLSIYARSTAFGLADSSGKSDSTSSQSSSVTNCFLLMFSTYSPTRVLKGFLSQAVHVIYYKTIKASSEPLSRP